MTSLALNAESQITLTSDLLQHLGIQPGQRLDVEKLPNSALRIKAIKPRGSIDNFIGRFAGKTNNIATIEEINDVIAAGWAGEIK